MSSGPGGPSKDKRMHDADVKVILAYSHALLEELGFVDNATSPPTPNDPICAGSDEHKQIRQYLEGTLCVLGGDPSALKPGSHVPGSEFTGRVLNYIAAAVAAVRQRSNQNGQPPTEPTNPGDPVAWVRDYTKVIFLEIAKKKNSQPSAQIRRVPDGADKSENAKVLVLLDAIAKRL